MRKGSPGRIVLLSTFAVAISLLLIESITLIRPSFDTGIFRLLLIPVAMFIISLLVFYTAVSKYIEQKIKVIYRNIRDLRSGNLNETHDNQFMNRDILSEVNNDVLIWAKDKAAEIETLREQAVFRKEFLGNVSHELKTPIMSIQGYLDTLAEGGLFDDRINRDYIEKAQRNVNRLVEIVNDLDSISKLESGSFELKQSRFDICNLVKEVFEALEMQAEDAGILLSVRKECDTEQWVMADKKLIREVLINLITNAIKYGKENGKVEIGFYPMDKQLLVEVEDDGIGISQEHLSRVFERFFRTEKSRTRDAGGTGLGLSIVKHILEAHDQTIHVTSREGVGSVFRFTLNRS